MKVLLSLALIELSDSLVSPCWASPFWQPPQKEPKGLAPASGPGCAGVRSLHRRSEGRRTRAIHGPLRLSPHPCGSPLCATIPLTLLMGHLELPDSSCKEKAKPKQTSTTFQAARTPFPSGGRVEVSRRGTRGRDAERGMKGQGRPFVTAPGAASEGGNPGAAGAGCRVAFFLAPFSWPNKKKDSPSRAKPEVSAHSIIDLTTKLQTKPNSSTITQSCQSIVKQPCPREMQRTELEA